MHRVFGGLFEVETAGEALRVAVAGGKLLGPWAWALRSAGAAPMTGVLERSWARAAARALDLRLDISGAEHVDPDGSYLVAPLHESFIDAIALLHLPLKLRFAARKELTGWRVLGGYLGRSRHVMVDPEQPRQAYRDLLRSVPQTREAGEALVVFPQGSVLGIEIAFRQGVFRLADRFEIPVLPVVVTGGHRTWEHPFSPMLRFGERVSVRVLPPIPVGEAMAQADAIERHMKDVALGGVVAAPRRFDPARDGFWDGYRYEIDRSFPDLRTLVAQHRRRTVVPTSSF